MVHDFVPGYYFIEPTGADERWETLLQLFELRKNSYLNTQFFCDYKLWQYYEKYNPLTEIPAEITAKMFHYAPHYLRLNNQTLTALFLWYWRLFKIKRGRIGDLIKQRATLSALILFSVYAGYREIVLVGVDLNNPYYFWETSPSGIYPLQPANFQTGKIHRSADPALDINDYSIPIDRYIYLLESIVLKPLHISLSVASDKSMLYPRLKKYSFPGP